METTEKTIIPNFVVVAFDETEYWKEEIKNDCEKIEGVYLVDLNRVIYHGSLTPDYFAIFLYNAVHLNEGIDPDAWHNDNDHIESENDDMYVNGYSSLNIVHAPKPLTEPEWEKFREEYDTYEKAYEAYEEEQKEYYRSNHVY